MTGLSVEISRFAASDGFALAEHRWEVPEPRAHVVVAHGMTAHVARYADVASELNAAGLSVSGVDMRAHGRSTLPWRELSGPHVLLDDLATYVSSVAGASSVPVFVLGDSLGGCLSLTLAGHGRLPVRGLVTTSAAVTLPPDLAPMARQAAGLVSRLVPSMGLAANDTKLVSTDPQVRASIEADPLVCRRVPARLIAVALGAIDECSRSMDRIEVPLLVFHGTGDLVTDPAGARLLVERCASTDTTLRLLDGWYHDLLHEPERDQLLTELTAWIDQRI